jgi:tRNA (guanine-N7-)-methyltransferase
MPHIWLKDPDVNLLSAKETIFCGVNEHNEYLIALNFAGLEFALSLKPKGDKWLLKYDKGTRISHTPTLKQALNFVASRLNCQILFDNTIARKTYILNGLLESNSFDPLDFDGKKVFAEIGFGSGLFLENLALNNPQNSYIGVEIYKPSINKFLNRCQLNGINNTYAIDEDARIFFETLPAEFLDGLYVHFPVPWPDAPHRRVWSKEFVGAALGALKTDGFIHLRTDDFGYYEFAKDVVSSMGLQFKTYVNEQLDTVSKYEARWQRQNKNIFDIYVYRPNEINCAKISYNFEFKEQPKENNTIIKEIECLRRFNTITNIFSDIIDLLKLDNLITNEQINSVVQSSDKIKELHRFLHELRRDNKLQILSYNWIVLPSEYISLTIATDKTYKEFTT